MKRKLLELVEEMTWEALENLELERVADEAAKDAVRDFLAKEPLEETVYSCVREALGCELAGEKAAKDAVIAAVSDWVSDIVRGWLA